MSAAFLYAFFMNSHRRSFGSCVQIFREVEHLGVIAIVLVRVFIALRLAIRRHHLLRQSPSLGRPALRGGLDDLQRGSKVGEGALRVRIPRVRLGARAARPSRASSDPPRRMWRPSAPPSAPLSAPSSAPSSAPHPSARIAPSHASSASSNARICACARHRRASVGANIAEFGDARQPAKTRTPRPRSRAPRAIPAV